MGLSSRNVTYRVYPTKRQEGVLFHWLNLHRELYNAALQERREAYRKCGVSIGYNAQQNVLPEIKVFRPDLIPLGSQALQETLRRVDRGMKAFFRRIKAGEKPGYPRFRGSDRFDSFTYPGPAGWSISTEGKRPTVNIRNLGILKTRGKARFAVNDLERRCLTVKKKADRWYTTVTYRGGKGVFAREPAPSGTATGMDVGCLSTAVLADGTKIENPKFYTKMLAKLAVLQKSISRKKKGSGKRKKAKAIIARLHQKVACQRRDFHHQNAARIVNAYSVIGYEGNLNVKGMTRSARGTVENPGRNVKQKSGLNRSILDASVSGFIGLVASKAEEAGGHGVAVDKDGSTVDCCYCGARNAMALGDRVYRCRYCRLEIDRDRNSAINIMLRALETLRCGTHRRGEGICSLYEAGHHNQIAQAIGYW